MSNVVEKIVDGLNDAQKQAVLNPIDSCTKIVAGAGTGKTKIISKRFVKLVFDMLDKGIESPESKILVITFTDKAANEMKGRIVSELAQNGLNSTKIFNDELWISTFHSFCMKILKKYSIEAGLSPSFKMADEQQLRQIYDNLIKTIKYGETSYIENACEVLKDSGLSLEDLSVNTLNKLNKIADFDTLFDDIYSVIKKIKSLGIDAGEFLVRSTQAVKNYSQIAETIPFKFESKEDYANAWDEHLKYYKDDSLKIDSDVFDDIAGKKLILDKFGKRKAIEYGMAEGFPENIRPITEIELVLTRVICGIYALYQSELERSDVADFDDLINKTIKIFKDNELVRSYYQNYFKHIIVDEFQDTNGAQLELIELLLNPENVDLTYVGDRKQSIYGFRFAQMENLEVLFQNVQKRYGKNYEPINLSINYRSTPEVLHAVNYVTEQELLLEGENLSANPHKDFEKLPEYVTVTTLDGFENADEQKIAEAQYIAQEVNRLKNKDSALFKDFAVLVKSHSQADIVEKELKKFGIPSVKKVNTGFFKEPVVKNMISAFRMVKNINDEQAFYRLLKVVMTDSQMYEFKKYADNKLAERIGFDELRKKNLVQKVLDLKDEILESYALKILDTVHDIKSLKSSLSLMQIFEKLKSDLVLHNLQNDFDKQQAEINLKVLEMIVDDFSQNENYISVNSLLDYLEKAVDDKTFELPSIYSEMPDAVQILTIHASKGLEFKYVFVLSFSSSSRNAEKSKILFDMQFGDKPGFGIIVNSYKGKPNPKSELYKQIWCKPRDKNEALRLFYVAVSRAEKYLNVLSFEPYSSVKPAEYIENLSNYLC